MPVVDGMHDPDGCGWLRRLESATSAVTDGENARCIGGRYAILPFHATSATSAASSFTMAASVSPNRGRIWPSLVNKVARTPTGSGDVDGVRGTPR
jgi:hypothetical protein